MHQLLQLRTKIAFVGVLFLILNAMAPIILGTQYPVTIGAIATGVEFLIVVLAAKSWSTFTALPSWLRPPWASNLSGTWDGTIRSQWKKHAGDPDLPPILVRVMIRQNWLTFTVAIQTSKIESRSHGSHVIWDKEHEELRVQYFYVTDPIAAEREKNPPQAGCGYVTWKKSSPDQLFIRYTNDRGLGGNIEVTRVSA